MTFVIESGSVSPGGVSILAGVAACVTCELALGLIASDSSARGCVVPLEWQSPSHTRPIGTEVPLASIGLRWPNDVVELRDDRTPGRKLAGVLIEQSENLLFVGIGINVLHDPSDWPPELADKAISLRALGSRWSREDVARQLIASVDTLLSMPSSSVETYWGERNALCGHKRTFIHNGVRTTGKVVGIDPVNQILLRLDDGTMRALPALSTSLLHDE